MSGTGDDLASALACLRRHEPGVRIIGNVRAATLVALLTRTEAEQRVLAEAERFLSSWEAAGAVPSARLLPTDRALYDAAVALRGERRIDAMLHALSAPASATCHVCQRELCGCHEPGCEKCHSQAGPPW